MSIGVGPFILAIFIVLSGIVARFFTPESRRLTVGLIIFYLTTTLTGWLLANSDATTSPFIVIWGILGVFSAVFGLYGWVLFLVANIILVMAQALGGYIATQTFLSIAIAETLPTLIGPLIFGKRPIKKVSRSLSNTLSQVSNKSEVIINAIGDGVIFIDNQGLIRLINPAAQEILGWAKQDALSLNYKSILKLVNQKDEPLSDKQDPIYESLNENQRVRDNKLIVMTRNDKKLITSLVSSPIGEAGSGVIVVFRDITKETAEEREQAEFVSTASHEMRTPVASIEGYLSLALNPQTAQMDDRARDFITKAHASAQHLGRLFQDLLDVSKSEDGRMTNKPQVINLVPFVHDVVEGLTPKARQKGLSIVYKPIPDRSVERMLSPDYIVNLDNDHLNEVVSNLVENAIKYTPKGQIIVDVTGDDEHAIISVKDSGIGIPAEDIPHLFQKFYRVENKDTHNIGGTGLGLYLSRRLTELMNGRIWVESIRHQGSTFYVELPRISEQDAKKLIEQQKNRDSQTTLLANTSQNTAPNNAKDAANPITPGNTNITSPGTQTNQVPRGDALTPEQIAAYVAKQRALAASQNTNNSGENNQNQGK